MYFLFAASQRVGALLAEALADAPLDAGGYAFYSALRETQPTSPTDLARHLGMPVSTVLDTLSGLQRREHVARLRNPRDRRSYLVRLTDAGEQVHDETEVLFSEADAQLLAHLGGRRAELIEVLSLLKDAGRDRARRTAGCPRSASRVMPRFRGTCHGTVIVLHDVNSPNLRRRRCSLRRGRMCVGDRRFALGDHGRCDVGGDTPAGNGDDAHGWAAAGLYDCARRCGESLGRGHAGAR
ncbi:MAG: MarR family transcriptional regulator [Acidimicrobiaceae bacterium]|nr:MarR family transcriptional regulator [Acidimicrobiaceae bacterium]